LDDLRLDDLRGWWHFTGLNGGLLGDGLLGGGLLGGGLLVFVISLFM
jgi:hypothetical protein